MLKHFNKMEIDTIVCKGGNVFVLVISRKKKKHNFKIWKRKYFPVYEDKDE